MAFDARNLQWCGLTSNHGPHDWNDADTETWHCIGCHSDDIEMVTLEADDIPALLAMQFPRDIPPTHKEMLWEKDDPEPTDYLHDILAVLGDIRNSLTEILNEIQSDGGGKHIRRSNN